MLVSVFTPTHNERYLLEAYNSLLKQTYKEWEWVLVPNGKVKIPTLISTDKRVKVISYPEQLEALFGTNIGSLKKFACDNCSGELLVELDHDDWLTTDALARIAEAKKTNPEAGFIYSDCVGLYNNGKCEIFGEEWGWKIYQKEVNGRTYTAMQNFEVNARSLCEIYFCPNHVRVWSKEVYQKCGGHNPTMKVIDDHELICRTYLTRTKFHQIPDVLYFYRRHDNATTVHDNALIQIQQASVRDRFTPHLVKEWCRREGLPMYDLGAAHNKEEGYIGLDKVNADFIWDVNDGMWTEENSIGCIRAQDFLEHIPIGKVIPFMNNVYKMLAPGGWFITSTPSTDGRGAFCDPTHVSFWNELSFRYYCDQNYSKYVPEIECKFQSVRLQTHFMSQWHEFNKLPYVDCDMNALKGQRQPGLKSFDLV